MYSWHYWFLLHLKVNIMLLLFKCDFIMLFAFVILLCYLQFYIIMNFIGYSKLCHHCVLEYTNIIYVQKHIIFYIHNLRLFFSLCISFREDLKDAIDNVLKCLAIVTKHNEIEIFSFVIWNVISFDSVLRHLRNIAKRLLGNCWPSNFFPCSKILL